MHRIDPSEISKFDVEHALSIYAYDAMTMPAVALYDDDLLDAYRDVWKSCHIYAVGFLPRVDLLEVDQVETVLKVRVCVLGQEYALEAALETGERLIEREGSYFLARDGVCDSLGRADLFMQLADRCSEMKFEVLYVGQAFGKHGERSSIDRLREHKTLQEISIGGAPVGHNLHLVLLGIQPGNQIFTQFNPRAVNKDESGSRISAGLDQLFGTSERERVSVYEAALIRYFQPRFNQQLKDSFPSTRLSFLQSCYKNDYSAVVAEVCVDQLPFQIWSSAIEPKRHHVAVFDLHSELDRKAFFCVN